MVPEQPSFADILEMCVLTLEYAQPTRSPISFGRTPRANSNKTSCSRGLNR